MIHPLVYTIIVNWNRWPDTLTCITAAMATTYPNQHILIVDNHSDTDATPTIQARWPQVDVIRLPHNLGFAAGVNQGIRRALGQGAAYIFTLNNDATVDPHCLSELVATAQQNETWGIVGPKIYYRDAPHRIWFAGANRGRWSLSLMPHQKGQADGPQFAQPREVTYLCAGAMLIRRQVFEAVGLFDPGYFMYYEDCDFCIRVTRQGYRLRYVPTAQVWHQVAASTGGEGSPMEQYYRTCSVFRFLRQHAHGWHQMLLITLRILYIFGKIGQDWLTGQSARARMRWRGLQDGLGEWLRPCIWSRMEQK